MLKKHVFAIVLFAALVIIPFTIGNNTDVHYVIIYMLIYAMVGGTFFAQFFKYIDSDTVFPLSVSMIFVLVTVLGGIGNVDGPIIGSAIYYSLELLVRRLTGGSGSGLNLIIFGILIVLVTCFEPQGIIGVVKRIQGHFTDRKERGEGTVETHT